jgi:hypothetical protein
MWQSGFIDSRRRMQRDHKPMVRRTRLDFGLRHQSSSLAKNRLRIPQRSGSLLGDMPIKGCGCCGDRFPAVWKAKIRQEIVHANASLTQPRHQYPFAHTTPKYPRPHIQVRELPSSFPNEIVEPLSSTFQPSASVKSNGRTLRRGSKPVPVDNAQ